MSIDKSIGYSIFLRSVSYFIAGAFLIFFSQSTFPIIALYIGWAFVVYALVVLISSFWLEMASRIEQLNPYLDPSIYAVFIASLIVFEFDFSQNLFLGWTIIGFVFISPIIHAMIIARIEKERVSQIEQGAIWPFFFYRLSLITFTFGLMGFALNAINQTETALVYAIGMIPLVIGKLTALSISED